MAGELDGAYRPELVRQPGPPPSRPSDRESAVLIVAYRNPQMLRECLAAVDHYLPSLPVLAWDNSGAGYPGIDDVVSGNSSVRWFLGSPNVGFAAAVNALAREVPQHNLLLLNPDAVLLGPLTGTLAALRKPGVAAAAPLTIDDKAKPGRYRVWDVARREQNLIRTLVSHSGYSSRFRGCRWSDLYREQPHFVAGYLAGACLAISRDAWNAVGPFDEEFFLYGEESDWQRRARSVGWSLLLLDELGVVHTGHGTVADDSVAALRSRDLLRANIALNLEFENGPGQANVYLAGTSLLGRVQRSNRKVRAARRRPGGASPAIVLTTNRLVLGRAERQQVLLAAELNTRGYDVTIVCMERFGPLLADIPASIRVVRQPWWAPAVDINADRSIIITGDSSTEIKFGAIWRFLDRGRRWLVVGHRAPQPLGPTYSRRMAAAMRRSDGYVVSSRNHWCKATAFQNLGPRFFIAPSGVASATDQEPPMRPPPAAEPNLVMLSRDAEQKESHLVVEALNGLRELPWRLTIYGDSAYREGIASTVPTDLAQRVEWRNWPCSLEQALSDCDLLCVPSRSEALHLEILEAMARRVPVAAPAVGAIADVLAEGVAGISVRGASIEAWRAGLDGALRHTETWNDLGNKGFARMRASYTIEAMAEAYESAIAAVL